MSRSSGPPWRDHQGDWFFKISSQPEELVYCLMYHRSMKNVALAVNIFVRTVVRLRYIYVAAHFAPGKQTVNF